MTVGHFLISTRIKGLHNIVPRTPIALGALYERAYSKIAQELRPYTGFIEKHLTGNFSSQILSFLSPAVGLW